MNTDYYILITLACIFTTLNCIFFTAREDKV